MTVINARLLDRINNLGPDIQSPPRVHLYSYHLFPDQMDGGHKENATVCSLETLCTCNILPDFPQVQMFDIQAAIICAYIIFHISV